MFLENGPKVPSHAGTSQSVGRDRICGGRIPVTMGIINGPRCLPSKAPKMAIRSGQQTPGYWPTAGEELAVSGTGFSLGGLPAFHSAPSGKGGSQIRQNLRGDTTGCGQTMVVNRAGGTSPGLAVPSFGKKACG
jgi:hypothetical protein